MVNLENLRNLQMGHLTKWLFLSFVIILFDQITKITADQMLIFQQPNSVFPGFNLTLLYNKGAAFSFLSSAGGWQRWFFTVLSTGISIMLVFWLKNTDKNNLVLSAGLACILGGAIGNLIDRVIYGHVIDFVQMYYYANSCFYGFSSTLYANESICSWPAFNIADSAIFIGAGFLILDMIKEQKK